MKTAGTRQITPVKPEKVDEDLWHACIRLIVDLSNKLDTDAPFSFPVTRPHLIGTCDGRNVYIVSARTVMIKHDPDFVEGGNGHEDPKLCGKNEIYLADNVRLWDLPFILYHETIESRIMEEKGMSYDDAHDHANNQEIELSKKGLGLWLA